MKLIDSRRLTGANLLFDGTGAILDVACSDEQRLDEVISAWQLQSDDLWECLGWKMRPRATRRFPGGASLAVKAPRDLLYSATEVNEQAWAFAVARVTGESEGLETFEEAIARLRVAMDEESNFALLDLLSAAREHQLRALWDDDETSVGLGRGSRTWPTTDLPSPDDVPWSELHDVPVALVTGTNGKTTTVRLLAAMAQAAGRSAGFSSTDGIWVAGEQVEEGDYSGPGGARAVLRRPGVDLAILETARGGLLRRGLPIERAEVAVVTNVAEDHLGEYGIFDLEALADTKMLVGQAAERLVINAEDDRLAVRADASGRATTWFALDSASPRVAAALDNGEHAAFLRDGDLVWFDGERRQTIVRVEEVPVALGGAARHNIANALAAAGAALELGLPLHFVRQALQTFEPSPEATPGRLNVFEIGGVTALVDFAHNPHGVEALLATAADMPAERRLVLIGQAGDRDDESIRALARSAWHSRPDRVVIKEMPKYLRGRRPGEIPAMLSDELRRLGAAESKFEVAESEIDAVRRAFEWAQPGDLLLLLTQADRESVYRLLDALQSTDWEPGRAVP